MRCAFTVNFKDPSATAAQTSHTHPTSFSAWASASGAMTVTMSRLKTASKTSQQKIAKAYRKNWTTSQHNTEPDVNGMCSGDKYLQIL